jgi:VanZ family protein
MSSKGAVVFRLVPMVLTMGTIFFLSHQPGDNLSLYSLPGIDKLAHITIYSILAATVLFGFSEDLKRNDARKVIVITVVCCVVYGLSDEFHQYFIPDRSVSLLDLFADCGGAVMTCGLWVWWRSRRYQVPTP